MADYAGWDDPYNQQPQDTAPDPWAEDDHFFNHPGVDAPITEDLVRGLYKQYFPGYGYSDDEIKSHLGHPGGAQALTKFFEDQSKDYQAPKLDLTPIDPPSTNAPPTNTPGGGNAPSPTGGLLTDPFPGTFTPTPGYQAPAAPTFQGPTWKSPAAFVGPDSLTEQNDPGYQFRLKQGLGALETAAGAKGMSRSGAQLKGLQDYAQNYASGEFQNVWNRAADTYKTNYQTQYADPYAAQFGTAVQNYTGQLHGYDTQTSAAQRSSELDAQTNWNRFNFDWNAWRDRRNFTWDSNFQLAGA